MAGFRNTILYADNVDFVNSPPNITPQITQNGQLLIGNASGPKIQSGFLTSIDSSITITNGPGTIDLAANASAVGKTITGDTGGALSPTAGNWNILGSHGINTSGSGSTLTVAINNAITLGDLSAISAGSSALTAQTGDITITAGNFNLPLTSSANVGVVKVNSTSFLHSFGLNNTFLGAGSGNFTLTAQGSTAFGTNSLSGLTNGLRNTAIGNGTLQVLQSGTDNVAVGTGALNAQITNNFNTAIGSGALGLYTGGGNTAVGQDALATTVTGNQSVAVGYRALASTTSTDNTAVGFDCLQGLTTGNNNAALGSACGFNLVSGVYNVLLGKNAGVSYTSSESSNIIINNVGTLGDNNVIRIGTQGTGLQQQSQTYIAGVINTVSGRVVKITSPGAYPYTTLTTDYVIFVDTSAARTINLIASPVTGTTYRIKDNVGSAAANNITITPNAGNIDGASTYVINSNYGSIDLVYNGTSWSVL